MKKGACIEVNGYRISIQHSPTHMCGKDSVEVAVIKGTGHKARFLDTFPHSEHGVAGHVSAVQLIDILEWALKG